MILVATRAEGASPPDTKEPPAAPGTSHALILVGLPGDEEHEKLFADTARDWRDWLTGKLDFDPGHVHILFGKKGSKDLAEDPATREDLEKTVADLKKTLNPQDRLWVFFLGHGNYDGEHASFHIAGPDLHEDQLAKLFAGLSCREQVFWMTTSASGWFLKALSAKDRIVITATAAEEEYNETEFPQALATVTKRSLAQLDTNKDGKVSVLELFQHTVAEVEARFAADNRVPTEHAQLDDNGDGVGTEKPVPDGKLEGKKLPPDGWLAAKTYLNFKPSR